MSHNSHEMSHDSYEMSHNSHEMSHNSHEMSHNSHEMSHDSYGMSNDSYEMSNDSYEMSNHSYEMSNDSYDMRHVSGRLNRNSSSCVFARGGSRTAASSHCKGIELRHLSGTVFVYNKCLHVQPYTCIHTYTIMGVVHTYTHYNGSRTIFCVVSL